MSEQNQTGVNISLKTGTMPQTDAENQPEAVTTTAAAEAPNANAAAALAMAQAIAALPADKKAEFDKLSDSDKAKYINDLMNAAVEAKKRQDLIQAGAAVPLTKEQQDAADKLPDDSKKISPWWLLLAFAVGLGLGIGGVALYVHCRHKPAVDGGEL